MPAIPTTGFEKGSIKGLVTRTRAELVSFEWDLTQKTVTATIRSDIDQSITVSCKGGSQVLEFKSGEELSVSFLYD